MSIWVARLLSSRENDWRYGCVLIGRIVLPYRSYGNIATSVLNRMKVYRDETAPLLEFYRDDLKTVDAVGAVDEVFARALRALGK